MMTLLLPSILGAGLDEEHPQQRMPEIKIEINKRAAVILLVI